MLKITLNTKYVNIKKEELELIENIIEDLEMHHHDLNAITIDKPKVQFALSTELDRLNKKGKLSNHVVENITYDINIVEERLMSKNEYVVKTEVILSKIDTVCANSREEALEKVKTSEETKRYLSDLVKSNNFEFVDYKVIEKL